MCYVRLDKSALPRHGRLHTADEWLSLARQAMGMGTYHITLTGGEVLTRPDFEDIYTGLIEMGILASVLSNASLITRETVRLFQTYQPRKLRFTLYGGSNATYERLCGVPDGFDRVMRSLHLLKEGGVPFRSRSPPQRRTSMTSTRFWTSPRTLAWASASRPTSTPPCAVPRARRRSFASMTPRYRA